MELRKDEYLRYVNKWMKGRRKISETLTNVDVFVWWDLNLKSIETLVGRTARHWRGWWAWLYDGGVLCKFSKRK